MTSLHNKLGVYVTVIFMVLLGIAFILGPGHLLGWSVAILCWASALSLISLRREYLSILERQKLEGE